MDDICIQRAGQGSIGMELRHQRAEELGKLLINKLIPKSGKFHSASACGRCKISWNWNWRELALHILPKLRALLSVSKQQQSLTFGEPTSSPCFLWSALHVSLRSAGDHFQVEWVFVTNGYGHCGQLQFNWLLSHSSALPPVAERLCMSENPEDTWQLSY